MTILVEVLKRHSREMGSWVITYISCRVDFRFKRCKEEGLFYRVMCYDDWTLISLKVAQDSWRREENLGPSVWLMLFDRLIVRYGRNWKIGWW